MNTTKKPTATEPICAGDTIIYHDVLPAALADGFYERLRLEVQWQRMSHQGGEVPRLICVQGGIGSDDNGHDNNYIPVYRHPVDELPPLEPFTPTVLQIRQHVESLAGHPLNHVLIQHYRSGNDYISEHSDKTLDIVPGSYVCNMSLGAERMMIFRTKRDGSSSSPGSPADKEPHNKAAIAKRQSCRVQLPHNSLCRMGLATNMKWLHAIRQDKRADRDKHEAEMAFGGGRISLTFRQIGTFLNSSETLIWGQGAVAKTRAEARPVVNGQSDEAISMLQAFSTENHSSLFDWDRYYGRGFDVLHMSSAPRLFASSDKLVNTTIRLLLAELDIGHAKGSIGVGPAYKTTDDHAPSSLATAVRFVDNDQDRSTVHGLLAILLYLDSAYGAGSSAISILSSGKHSAPRHKLEAARTYTRLQQALLLQDTWRSASSAAEKVSSSSTPGASFSLKPWKAVLMTWDALLTPTPQDIADSATTDKLREEVRFIAGGASLSLADYAFWPILYSMEQALATAEVTSSSVNRTGSTGSKEPPPQSPQLALETELIHMGMAGLARYYTQLKSRVSFERVILAEEK